MNKSDKISGEIINDKNSKDIIEQIKVKEVEKINEENSNESLSEKNQPNIDSLLEDYSCEEEMTNINKETIDKKVQKIIEEYDNIEKERKENENKNKNNINEKPEIKESINKYNNDKFLNEEKKENIELSNSKEINDKENKDETKEKINEKNNDKENKNDNIINENIEHNIIDENFKKDVSSNKNNSEKEKFMIESKEKEEVKTNEEIKKNNENNSDTKGSENKNYDKEYDFDLDEEEDIDLIIKNKQNNSNTNNTKENSHEKEKEIEQEKEKEKIIKEINKNELINPNFIDNKEIKKENDNKDKNKISKSEPRLILPIFPNQKDKEVFIEALIKKIFSSNSIVKEENNILINIIFKNESRNHFVTYFLNFLQKRIKNKIRFLPNFDNFKILLNIIENICIKEVSAYIFDLIIEVSQYIKYENNYLYHYFSKKFKLFQKSEFWKSLIDNVLINALNDRIKYIINRENIKKEEKKKSDLSAKKTSSWTDFFMKAFKSDSLSDDEEENITIKDSENNSTFIIDIMGYPKNMPDYNKLNIELKKELNEYSKKCLENILCKSIRNMSNYGFNADIMKILIINFCAQFSFQNELKEYFINLIEIYQYKNHKYLKQNLILKNKNNLINDKSIVCIISNIFIFLPIKERIKLFLLNKKLNTKYSLKKEIFIKLLRQKNLSLINRLIIWEDILNISKLKAQYNYSEIKESTFKKLSSGEIQKGTRLYNNNETITKDVNRTVFLIDKVENQKKLANILRCLNLLIPSIGYYQGISYIAGFILQLLDFNEEKTFFYILALETQTNYKNLFYNNLELLNNNFIIFDKLLEIGLPEVYLHFNKYRISANQFTPSWFLTIFICILPIFDKNNVSKFCILVFEKFILDGWDAVFNAGFTALKVCSREIIKIKEDIIYNYLTNEFSSQDIFKNSNFDSSESDFINNSGFINDKLILLLNKICNYEKELKDKEN